jgi:hypothetical protein
VGWRGTLRSIGATTRRLAREAAKEHARLEKLNAQKLAAMEARNAIQEFERYVAEITSLHRGTDCEVIDWHAAAATEIPEPPVPGTDYEDAARRRFETFKPGLFETMFGTSDKRRKELEAEISRATEKDVAVHAEALASFEEGTADLVQTRDLGQRLLEGNADSYLDVVAEVKPFSDIEHLGTNLNLHVYANGDLRIDLRVHGEEIVPKDKYSLRTNGSLQTKAMPKGEFYEIYQDYVCSCVLRVAVEIFAVLPLERVLINATDALLNPRTGHVEELPLLSVIVGRDTLQNLNLDRVDPSDAMGNFIHNMKFRKTGGLTPVPEVKFP